MLRHNQKGFTYPLTLCMLILFSTILAIYLEQYLTEKRMLTETENILKQEYYIVSTLKTMEESLAVEGRTNHTGSIEFYDGQAEYVIEEITGSLWEIKLQIKTGIDSRQFSGTAFYDTDYKKIIKWVEKS
ncbi:competence type IV pilus minor pilin ComGG [Niallia endozanthoxylica]|nr:competence type IV pilus minor pilin ComGG [Niallia endozanthoxylica]